MSIRCVCPNGHVLNVRESLAGTLGLCPTCRARLKVPPLRAPPVSEDAILDFLGRQETTPQAARGTIPEVVDGLPLSEIHERGTPKKSCYRCNQEIAAGTHICPHCHTYIANLDDF